MYTWLVFPIGKKKRETLGDAYFRTDYVQIEDTIYLASCLANYVLKFSLVTLEYEWFSVGSKDNRYAGIAWDGEYFWLPPRVNNTIVKWDAGKEVIELPLPSEFNKDKVAFLGAIYSENNIIIPGFLFSQTIVIPNRKISDSFIKDEKYLFFKQIDEETTVSLLSNGFLTVINKENKKLIFECKVEKSKVLEFLKTQLEKIDICNEFLFENDVLNLDIFLELLSLSNIQKMDCYQGNTGEIIWEKIQS